MDKLTPEIIERFIETVRIELDGDQPGSELYQITIWGDVYYELEDMYEWRFDSDGKLCHEYSNQWDEVAKSPDGVSMLDMLPVINQRLEATISRVGAVKEHFGVEDSELTVTFEYHDPAGPNNEGSCDYWTEIKLD